MNEETEKQVRALLENDRSGHDWSHIQRVRALSQRIAAEENADPVKTDLIALLHDADDYKLVGKTAAAAQSNAGRILESLGISGEEADEILQDIAKIGYSKSLKGLEPAGLEARIVQDADFLDALGALGLLRAHEYGLSKHQPFFDPSVPPLEQTDYETYTTLETHAVQHFFDKLLVLEHYMTTDSGRREARRRSEFLYGFLEELFTEEDSRLWLDYLHSFGGRHADSETE